VTTTGICFEIFFEGGLPRPAPATCDEELFGREFWVLERTALGSPLAGVSGPVDRMKSAKSRREASLLIGSRGSTPETRGLADLGIGFGCTLTVSREDFAPCVGAVGLVLLLGFERRLRPLSLVDDLELFGRSGSSTAGAEWRRTSASSSVSERE